MDATDVRRWFDRYLDCFEACGRGESETPSLLAYYDVPLLVTTDDGFFTLTSGDQVVAMVRRQIDGMRAAAFHHVEAIEPRVNVVNQTSAFYHATFSRQRSDGSEIARLTSTYLVTDGQRGRRVSVLAVHGR
jgi:hypothetical protein